MGYLDQTILFVNYFKFSRNLPFGNALAPWIGIAIYLMLILILSIVMSAMSEPVKILNFSRVHNLILCVWSAIMFIGVIYNLGYHIFVNNRSISYLVTDPNLEVYESLQFWFYIYYLSKYYEIIDTFILILKKKSLIALHVWHHAVMMYLGWLWTDSKWTLVWYGMAFNTFVHVLMYYYYFVSTFGIRVWWKRHLTKLQLIQFFTVFTFIFYWFSQCLKIENDWRNYNYMVGDIYCSGNYTRPWVIVISQIVNITFLALFGNFYYQAYTKPRRMKKKQ
eukprot:83091_1